ncbi:MAG: hypothetical protein AB7W37_08185 [Syntrophobacteraceae bacterium]
MVDHLEKERTGYRSWLKKEKALSPRSVSDILSRTKRVSVLVDVLKPSSEEELKYLLGVNPNYRRCTMTVRSQLKRAAILYREYVSGISKEACERKNGK